VQPENTVGLGHIVRKAAGEAQVPSGLIPSLHTDSGRPAQLRGGADRSKHRLVLARIT
jgi:hypothetical protein